MLRAGDPVDRDDRLARDLLVRGAEMGHTPSMIELAQMLKEGLGGPADIGEAHRWIRLAAERGNGQGQLAWARTLKDGDGVPPNAKEALVWFRLAEAVLAGHTEAQQAKEAAEVLTANLGDASVVEVASRIAAFRPVPPGAVWNLPSDWAVWEQRHPLNRVRGTTLFEMPEFAAIFRPLLGTPIYTTLASRSGPGSITINGDWLLVSACKAHFCHRDHFFLALRRDGRDAAACVLTPEEVPGTRRLIGNLTYARMHAPRQLREDIANTGCPHELPMLLSIARPPPERPPLALDRDAPWPPPVATPVAPRQAPPPQAAARPRVTVGQLIGTGTAWRVADGRFVTSAHVIEGCGTIRLSAGGPIRDIARILAKDTSLDLALLQADVATIGVLSVRTAPPRPGEPVVVAGYPMQGVLASGPQVSTGIVTALAGLQDDITRLQISAPVQPGNSGGPVLDRQGVRRQII